MSSEFQSSLDKSVTGLKALILNSLKFRLARDTATATKRDWWLATSKAVQSIIVERMIATATVHHDHNAKRVYYLSLSSSWGGSFPTVSTARASSTTWCMPLRNWVSTTRNSPEEYDMGLGNGGLGRLASCFLDSLATLDLQPSATESITNTGSSSRNSATAIRSSCPTHGCNSERLGNRPARARHGNPSLWLRRKRLRRPGQLRPALDGLEETGRHPL